MTPSQLEQIRKFAQEVAIREGCLLYDLEYREGPGRALVVYIDRDTAGGVSITDCSNVSKGLNLRLDVEDAVPGGHYDLEVSSPGLDRKLTQDWHYQKAVGQVVTVKYADESGQTKSYEGRLVSASPTEVTFENSKGPFILNFSQIQKARVRPMDLLAKQPAPGKKKR